MYLLRTEYATKCISDIAQLFHKCKSLLHFLDFPWGSAGKESACNVRDLGLIPGLGRSPGEGKGYPLQYSGMENSMDCIVHGDAKSQTELRDFHFHHISGSAVDPLSFSYNPQDIITGGY